MDDNEFREPRREERRRRAELPWEEWIRPMVEEGISGEDGNVIVCAPPTPRTIID